MAETFTQKQVRLVLERQCRELADMLKAKVPAGVGFILFLADHGEKGNLAYVATVERESAIETIYEWLDHQDANADRATLQALLITAGESVKEIAAAVGYKGELGDLDRLIAHCRELKRKADR